MRNIYESKEQRSQLKEVITYVPTRHLKKLVQQLSEREYELVQQLTAHIPPLTVDVNIPVNVTTHSGEVDQGVKEQERIASMNKNSSSLFIV